MTDIFKVISQGEPQQVQKQDGSVLYKCPITLQKFGAWKDENMFAAVLLGDAAHKRWEPGDIVCACIRFTAHVWENRTYQDIFVTEIMKLA